LVEVSWDVRRFDLGDERCPGLVLLGLIDDVPDEHCKELSSFFAKAG